MEEKNRSGGLAWSKVEPESLGPVPKPPILLSDLQQKKKFLRVLAGDREESPPVWIMRQAGRYLPEYRQLRARARSFLEFCYSPALASEAALQPIRRFGFDAAILFSDILTIPDALGRKVHFDEGKGPRLAPLVEEQNWRFDEPTRALQRLAPVYETVERTRAALDPQTALIGFAGGPWTVACYMLQGEGGEKDVARRAAYQRAHEVDVLLVILAETTALHLAQQARMGADCLQIFESWAQGLSTALFTRLVIAPTRHIVARLRALGVSAPVIGFPRAATETQIELYARETGVTALSLDTAAEPASFRNLGLPLQGNLDPQLLVTGGAPLERGVRECLDAFSASPHIFNLGHGITPDASPDNVAHMIRLVRGA
ncbi:MAG: uroporphyrinogen decarboxylase [Hyphomonadaceae bacterium]|nr:uroporphyrinogen decarboxylase [Hyphomonadaceae bacterium]